MPSPIAHRTLQLTSVIFSIDSIRFRAGARTVYPSRRSPFMCVVWPRTSPQSPDRWGAATPNRVQRLILHTGWPHGARQFYHWLRRTLVTTSTVRRSGTSRFTCCPAIWQLYGIFVIGLLTLERKESCHVHFWALLHRTHAAVVNWSRRPGTLSASSSGPGRQRRCDRGVDE